MKLHLKLLWYEIFSWSCCLVKTSVVGTRLGTWERQKGGRGLLPEKKRQGSHLIYGVSIFCLYFAFVQILSVLLSHVGKRFDAFEVASRLSFIPTRQAGRDRKSVV